MWSMELKFQHHMGTFQLSSVQSLSRVRLFLTPWIAARQDSLSITNSPSSPKLMSIESVMPSSHLILCHSLLLLPPIPPSIRVFSSDSTFRMRWPKYWRFSFSISTSKEHPGVISQKLQIWSLSQTYYIRSAFNKIIKWVEWALMFETNCSYNGTPLQYSCLEMPWTVEPGGLQSIGSLRVRNDWATSLSLFTFMHWRRKWQPTPVFLPGESQGWRGLVGCCLWGHTESDTTEAT